MPIMFVTTSRLSSATWFHWHERRTSATSRGSDSFLALAVCGEVPKVLLELLRGQPAAWRSGAVRDVFPRVVWITENERRAELLTDICASMPPTSWKLFAVTTPDRALKLLTKAPGEPS